MDALPTLLDVSFLVRDTEVIMSSAAPVSGQSSFGIPLGGTTRIVLSLRVGVALALANIFCVSILAWAWVYSHPQTKSLTVTGSAKRAIRSDLIVWQANISATAPTMGEAYAKLQDANAKTAAYLAKQGIPSGEIVAMPICTTKHFAVDKDGHDTDAISSWELGQALQVSGGDVDRITEVANQATSLIKDGVQLQSGQPKYLYTKLADLKIEMLAAATDDAKTRAGQIATHSGAKLGELIDAHMGVMQINAMYSDDATAEGVNDTTSLDKEVRAVVDASFSLK
jgi:uncharacterized protein